MKPGDRRRGGGAASGSTRARGGAGAAGAHPHGLVAWPVPRWVRSRFRASFVRGASSVRASPGPFASTAVTVAVAGSKADAAGAAGASTSSSWRPATIVPPPPPSGGERAWQQLAARHASYDRVLKQLSSPTRPAAAQRRCDPRVWAARLEGSKEANAAVLRLPAPLGALLLAALPAARVQLVPPAR
jgi:hypothetical protein